jgi:hypothetical protein
MNLDEVVGELVEGSHMIRQLARKTYLTTQHYGAL